ncbi:MAG: phage head-tail connector protein [Hyphomonadaceae bacterium]|nr:phage head-tail connector protein [Hyphomonadaceae bacterium]
MTLTVITPPATPPVALAEMKAFLRIGHDSEDTLVADLTEAATGQVEGLLGKVLVTRTLERCYQAWPPTLSGRGAHLRPGPVSALTSVTVLDADDVGEDVTSRFKLDCGRLRLRPWSFAPAIPAGGLVKVRFEAGYGAASAVPADLILAVQRMAQETYRSAEFGDGRSPGVPRDVEGLLAAYREIRL